MGLKSHYARKKKKRKRKRLFTCYDNRESCIFNIARAPRCQLVSAICKQPQVGIVSRLREKAKLNVAKYVNLLLENIPTPINKINKIHPCQGLPHPASQGPQPSFPHLWSLKLNKCLCCWTETFRFWFKAFPKYPDTLRLLTRKRKNRGLFPPRALQRAPKPGEKSQTEKSVHALAHRFGHRNPT